MRILRSVLEEVLQHAREAVPAECCGILLAADEDDLLIIEALRAENTEEDPTQGYGIGHQAHLAAMDRETSGEAVIAGYYHSHPHSRPVASARDREDAVDFVSYLIVGVLPLDVMYTAWRGENDTLIQEPLEIVAQ